MLIMSDVLHYKHDVLRDTRDQFAQSDLRASTVALLVSIGQPGLTLCGTDRRLLLYRRTSTW